LKVGSFCAGSNITGNYFDTDRIAILCHKYDTLAFFDYAGVGSYNSINMSGLSGRALYPDEPKQAEAHLAYKDAIFLSPHKFAGGPGSSGVLLAKKKIFNNKKPHFFGGGIVMYVNEQEHELVSDMEEIEEAGTPGIIQDIRAALACQLKEAVSTETIHEME